MPKRLLAGLFTFLVIFSFCPSAVAENNSASAEKCAEVLHDLGLFNGVGIDENGVIIYDLNRSLTRQEAIVILVRLLGKENEALAKEWQLPFNDIDDWAMHYVGYAYNNGLTNGISKNTFGGKETITTSQFITYVLRALGYDSKIDFDWNDPYKLSDKLGITYGEYSNASAFNRSNAVTISYAALTCKYKNQNQRLIDILISNGVIDKGTANKYNFINYSIDNAYTNYYDVPDYSVMNNTNIIKTISFNSGYVYIVNISDNDCKLNYVKLLENCGYSLITYFAPVKGSTTLVSEYMNDTTGRRVFISRDVKSMNNTEYNIIYIFIDNNFNADIEKTISDYFAGIYNPDLVNTNSANQVYDNFEDVPTYQSITGSLLVKDENNLKLYSSTQADKNLYELYLLQNGYVLEKSSGLSTYFIYYYDSKLLYSSAGVNIYKNSNGTEVHITSVEDLELSADIVLIKVNEKIIAPDINAYMGKLIADMKGLNSSNTQYLSDRNNYKYGNSDSIYGSPIYVRKASVNSMTDLKNFLNNKYDYLYSPVENLDLDIEIWDNSSVSSGQSLTIHIDFGYVSSDISTVITPLNFADLYGYSDAAKEETVTMLQDMMHEIYQDTVDIFPSASINGCIYVSGFHYPYIKVDYYFYTAMSWTGVEGFKWIPENDTFKIY